MKPTLVISDLHIGVSRVAGTTPESAKQLRRYLQDEFARLLNLGYDRVIINGDLTDEFDIPLSEALDVYAILDAFMAGDGDREVILAAGNHDLSKDSSKLGTVQFVGSLLEMKYPGRFKLVTQPTTVEDFHIIPHVVNQDRFDLALDQVPDCKYLFLHCNYDSPFAAEAEHSLNLSREQGKALTARGITVVLGHEHQGRTAWKGKLIVVGNNFPSSCSDCMAHGDGQLDGKKYALVIDDKGHHLIETWQQAGNFAVVDWRDLGNFPGDHKFIRVTGKADAEEAADVIKTISTFRKGSQAFVVTNAVKIAQLVDVDGLEVSAEDVRNVDVISMLLDSLTEEQAAVVRQLMEEKE